LDIDSCVGATKRNVFHAEPCGGVGRDSAIQGIYIPAPFFAPAAIAFKCTTARGSTMVALTGEVGGGSQSASFVRGELRLADDFLMYPLSFRDTLEQSPWDCNVMSIAFQIFQRAPVASQSIARVRAPFLYSPARQNVPHTPQWNRSECQASLALPGCVHKGPARMDEAKDIVRLNIAYYRELLVRETTLIPRNVRPSASCSPSRKPSCGSMGRKERGD
jgi:hypothetical protein